MKASKANTARSKRPQILAAAWAAMTLAVFSLARPASAALIAPGGGTWDFSQRGTTFNSSGYKLTYDDEFTSLDLGCWQSRALGTHRWYMFNSGSAGIATTPCAAGNVSVSNGLLAITAKRSGGVWTSGAIQTMDILAEGFKQQYGYFVARIYLPSARPAGIDFWPSFWLQGRWTSAGSFNYPEIDVLESWAVTTKGVTESTLHAWPSNPVNPAILPTHEQTSLMSGTNVFDDRWHTYALKYTSNYWTIYLDNVELGRYPVNMPFMNSPIYPILDLAISPATPAGGAAAQYTMYVDYVRAYACTSVQCQGG
jgi:beta-glucanase (GH16 family)